MRPVAKTPAVSETAGAEAKVGRTSIDGSDATAASGSSASPKTNGASRRTFVEPGTTPVGVVHWRRDDHQQRRGNLSRWRRAVLATFKTEVRPVRVAWAIYDLCASRGYAYAGNPHLAVELGMTSKKIDEALNALKNAGAIIVVWVNAANGSKERRIYPATEILANDPIPDGWVGSPRSKTSPSCGGYKRAKPSPHAGDDVDFRYPPTAGDDLSPDQGGTESKGEEKAQRTDMSARLSGLRNRTIGRAP